MSIRILLADDHKMLSQGLSDAVNKEGDMEVVGVAENGVEVVAMAERLQPDVVIMDITMPLLNGIEATRQIVAAQPLAKVIGLSMHAGSRLINGIIGAGAKGYVLKDCEYKELMSAIKTVMSGQIYITPNVGDITLKAVLDSIDAENASLGPLSERERQVVKLFAEGNTTKQVADILEISPKTVEGHRSKIFNKLDIDNMADLTRYAIRERITSLGVNGQ